MLKDIIRSEAHFAAMLFCEISHNQDATVRDRFLNSVRQHLEKREHSEKSVGEIKQVFVEPAPFRDAWKSLSHSQRRELVECLLIKFGIDRNQTKNEILLDKKGRLSSPASWARGRGSEIWSEIEQLYFLFRARPDLLIVTTEYAMWVELKVESRTRLKQGNYSQSDTQKVIAELAPLVLPDLKLPPLNILIQRENRSNPDMKSRHSDSDWIVLSWHEIVGGQPGWDFKILAPKQP